MTARVTTAQAAEILGTTRYWVGELVRRRELPAELIGRGYQIPVDALAAYRARKPPRIHGGSCTHCGAERAGRSRAHGWCAPCTNDWYRLGRPDTGPSRTPAGFTADQQEDFDFLCSQGVSRDEALRRVGLSPGSTIRRTGSRE